MVSSTNGYDSISSHMNLSKPLAFLAICLRLNKHESTPILNPTCVGLIDMHPSSELLSKRSSNMIYSFTVCRITLSSVVSSPRKLSIADIPLALEILAYDKASSYVFPETQFLAILNKNFSSKKLREFGDRREAPLAYQLLLALVTFTHNIICQSDY